MMSKRPDRPISILISTAGLALWLVLLSIVLPIYAMMAPISLEDLVKGSSHIVIGRAGDIVCRWAEQWSPDTLDFIYTGVTVHVDEYIKGESAGDSLGIVFAGGTMEIPVPDEPGIFVYPPMRGLVEELGIEGVLEQYPMLTRECVVWEFSEQDIADYKARGVSVIEVGMWVEDTPEFAPGETVLTFLSDTGNNYEGKREFSVVGKFQGKYTIVGDMVVRDGEESPLDEFLDRIDEVMEQQAGVEQTTWGQIKSRY